LVVRARAGNRCQIRSNTDTISSPGTSACAVFGVQNSDEIGCQFYLQFSISKTTPKLYHSSFIQSYTFLPLPAGLLGPSTARSTCPAIPSLLASNWLPITPSLLNGPPTFWPIWPMAPSGLNCLPIAPAEEIMLGFYGN
jgi:hypothetical protein